MGAKSAPEAPDYRGAAEEQAESSREVTTAQTYANRPTQITPWGRVDWTPAQTRDPGTGENVTTWQQEMTLDPDEQAALDSQQAVQLGRSGLAQGLIERTGQELEDPVNWRQMPEMGELDPSALPEVDPFSLEGMQEVDPFSAEGLPALDAAGGYQQSFADTAYDRSASLIEPRNERARAALDARLRNQGLTPGSEAYDNAMGDLRDQQGETMTRLAQDSVFRGSDEQQRQFEREMAERGMYGGERMQEVGTAAALRAQQAAERGQQFDADLMAREQAFQQQLQGGSYQNILRQQAIAEEAQRRGWSINEMNALLTGQQVSTPSMPGFMGAERSEAAQYLRGAESQGAFDQSTYSTAMGPVNAAIGAAGSFGASDARLKTNVKRIGSTPKGLPVYTWDWTAEGKRVSNNDPRRVGVMAHELQAVNPAAVSVVNGYLHVDYSQVE